MRVERTDQVNILMIYLVIFILFLLNEGWSCEFWGIVPLSCGAATLFLEEANLVYCWGLKHILDPNIVRFSWIYYAKDRFWIYLLLLLLNQKYQTVITGPSRHDILPILGDQMLIKKLIWFLLNFLLCLLPQLDVVFLSHHVIIDDGLRARLVLVFQKLLVLGSN